MDRARPPRPAARHPLVALLLALALALPPLALVPPACAAGPCEVTSPLDDGGTGTVRARIADASCATVTFAPGLGPITLTDGLGIFRAVTLDGPGQIIQHPPGMAHRPNGWVVYVGPGGDATLRGLTLQGGRVNGGSWGGGLHLFRGRATLDGATVRDNEVIDGNGGGIYVGNGTLVLRGTAVTGNRADSGNGGGIYVDDQHGPSAITIERGSRIAGNTAERLRPGYGGGIYIADATGWPARVTLIDSAIVDNRAMFGGGIHALDTLAVSGSTIAGNFAEGSLSASGGGIVATGHLSMVSSTISGNQALGSGGGLKIASNGGATRTAALIATTIVGNTAGRWDAGIGVNATDGTLTVQLDRAIVAGNIASSEASDCLASGAGASIAPGSYNLVGLGGGCPAGGTGTVTLVGALATAINPALAANGGPTPTHDVVPGGPAHNKIPEGDCGLTTDQRGAPRPDTPGGRCDIGAVEYTPAPPSPTPSSGPSTSPTPTPPPSGPPPFFADVPPGYWAHDQITRFAQRGITTGCDTDPAGVRYYCPERPVTRAEMAAFLIRTLTGTTAAPAGPATPTFADVPTDHPQYGYIEALVARGITTGCGGSEYCPDREVTRAEMAAFIIRALTGSTTAPPGPAAATFGDVPPGHPQYGFIEAMAARRITTGCGDPNASPRTYCPDSNVTRAEMAVFVIRAYP